MKERTALVAILAVGTGLRLAIAALNVPNFDLDAYAGVAGIVHAGGNVYAETPFYNYTPLWMHVLDALDSVSRVVNLPLSIVVRAFLALVDLVIALLLWRIGSRAAAAAYALNPTSVLLTGLHGQFDNLAAVPLLAALWLTADHPRRSGRILWTMGSLSLIIKHSLACSVWMLLVVSVGLRRAVVIGGLAAAAWLLTFLPYLPAGWDGILHNVILYRSDPGWYGLSVLLPAGIVSGLFATTMLALPILARRIRMPAAKSLELSALAFLALAPGFGGQYLIMAVIFGSLHRGVWYWAFSAIGAVATLCNMGIVGDGWAYKVAGYIVVWVMVLFWLGSYVWPRLSAHHRAVVPLDLCLSERATIDSNMAHLPGEAAGVAVAIGAKPDIGASPWWGD